MSFLICFFIALLSSFTWRVRGGLRIPHTDKKFPLNKYWFAVFYALSACYLKGWETSFFFTMLIASILSSQLYGWGEGLGCVLGVGKPDPERRDCELIDDIMDCARISIKGREFKLIDFPIFWGWCWVSLRGLILTFIIGLALNSIPYMLCGLSMGTVYYLGGLFARKVLKKYDKTGWNLGELFWGIALGIFLILFA